MPLGFAKSTLALKSASLGANPRRAFRGNGGPTQTGATYYANFNASTLSSTSGWTFVMWLRMKPSDFDDHIKILDARPPASGNHQFSIWMEQDGGTDKFSNNGIVNLSFDGQNPTLEAYPTSPFNTQASANANVFDGAWHCWMWTWKQTSGGGDTQLYFEDTDVKTTDGTFTTTDFPWNNSHSWQFLVSGIPSTGAQIDVGPIWFYNNEIDLDDSNVRSKFFNSSNTDGYVDGGTDGTAGGQPTPTVYLYHNGTTLVDGRGTTDSITTVGSPVALPDTEGPGSGHTR